MKLTKQQQQAQTFAKKVAKEEAHAARMREHLNHGKARNSW